MPKSNPLITVGGLTFTVAEVTAILEKVIDIEENVPQNYSPATALLDIHRLMKGVREEPYNAKIGVARLTSRSTGGILGENGGIHNEPRNQ